MNNVRKWLVVSGIVFLIVAGVIGFVASKFGGNKNNAANTAKSSNTSSTQQDAGPKLHNANEALALVRTTYVTASSYLAKGNSIGQGEIDAVKNFLDADLYTQLTQTFQVNLAAGDQVLCTNLGGAMTGYSVNFSSISGTSAQILLTQNYDTPVSVLYTVDLASLKISSITCQPLQ